MTASPSEGKADAEKEYAPAKSRDAKASAGERSAQARSKASAEPSRPRVERRKATAGKARGKKRVYAQRGRRYASAYYGRGGVYRHRRPHARAYAHKPRSAHGRRHHPAPMRRSRRGAPIYVDRPREIRVEERVYVIRHGEMIEDVPAPSSYCYRNYRAKRANPNLIYRHRRRYIPE